MEDVEAAVQAQEEHVVGSYVLDVAQLVYHVQLRQDGQRLQPDAERPQEVQRVQRLVDQDGCEEGGGVEVVVGECVCVAVEGEGVGLFELHEVDRVARERDEHDLHHEHVQRLPPEQQVDVPRQEHHEEHLLRPVRQACILPKVPITFLLATILSSSMSTAMRWRKSPMNWNMSIRYVLFDIITHRPAIPHHY